MLSDCLAKPATGRKRQSVHTFAALTGLGQVVCTDIGRYKLLGPFTSVQFAHSKILKTWPGVKSTPDDFDVFAEFKKASHEWVIAGDAAINIESWASQTSLRLWVALWEEVLEYAEMGEELPELEASGSPRSRFSLSNWAHNCSANPEDVLQLLPKDDSGVVKIHQLGPEHSSSSLSYVTEFLALNIEAYYRSYIGADFVLMSEIDKPKWAELGEGSHGTDEAQKQQKGDQAHKEQYGIVNPVNDGEWYIVDDVEDMILGSKRSVVIFGGEETVLGATKSELQGMAYLLIAAGMLEVDWTTGDEDDETSLANWSRPLLQRHFALARPERALGFSTASLKTLRRYFCTTVRTIRHVKGGRVAEASTKKLAKEYRAGLQSTVQQDGSLEGISGQANGARAMKDVDMLSEDGEDETAHELDGMICNGFIQEHAAHLVMAVCVEDDVN